MTANRPTFKLDESVIGVIRQLNDIRSIAHLRNDPEFGDTVNNIEEILQFRGYTIVCSLDMRVIGLSIGTATESWAKIYFVKAYYLLVYESLNTWKHHNNVITKLINKYPSLEVDFKELSTAIKNFKKNISYHETVAKARNHSAAHINKEFETYVQAVTGFDLLKIKDSIKDFIDIINKMKALIGKIVDLMLKKLIQIMNDLNISIDF